MRRLIVVGIIVAAVMALAACSAGASLTGKTWQWTASTTKVPASQSNVPDPSNYTIEFKTDGTYQAKADCNTVSGTYTSTASGGLTINPGASSLAACGPDSLSDIYVQSLGQAIGYTFFGQQLTINLSDLGTMTFK
jgi:heat shock protein HslJ